MQADILEIPFTKMTGAGNDFIMIDNRELKLELEWSELAKSLCSRHFGIGGDGLISLETSEIADFRMNYFNADGSYGGMCGNGGRCSAALALTGSFKKEVRFEALDYIYTGRRAGNVIVLSMKNPYNIQLNNKLSLGENEITAHFVNTGSPHAVVFAETLPLDLQNSIAENGIQEIGSLLRYHPAFAPDGANCNFVWMKEGGMLRLRTHERGVEGETLACGTGTVAVAVISSILHELSSPVQVLTEGGEVLTVSFNKSHNEFTDIGLSGSAKVLFQGVVRYDTFHHQICS